MFKIFLLTAFLYINHPVTYAVKWLCETEYKAEQARLNVTWSKHPLLKNKSAFVMVSNGVILSSQKHNLDPNLILATAWKESRLDPRVLHLQKLGKKGEQGAMQLHGIAAEGCNMSRVSEQIECGSAWLKKCITKCNDITKGFGKYITGRCSTIKPALARTKLYERLTRVVNDRKNSNK